MQQIALAFPTLIGQFQLPDTAPVNEALTQSILEREKKRLVKITPIKEAGIHKRI